MKIYYNPRLKTLARNLRKNSTLAEVLMWNELKGRRIKGLQFMRQKPIGNFIVDFYSSRLKLAIEIDGDSHGYLTARKRDLVKEEFLKSLSIHTLRYDDSDVKSDIGRVLEHLIDWIECRTTP